MLNRILKKRTQIELDSWQAVRDLMPRNRKSKGIQYEALEFLFEHLYERVTEEDLASYLLEVKGHLQRTGDPVKGAINQAVKELQRQPDRSFEIVKIQEATATGPRRLVQMNFVRFEEVIDIDLYSEYLRDVLKNESDMVLRGVSRFTCNNAISLFPGLTFEMLANCRSEFLVGPDAEIPQLENIGFKYIPPSAANIHFLMVYENKDQRQPFLGFVARSDLSRHSDQEFIFYRGREKESKLKFLDRIWQDLCQQALEPDSLAALRRKAMSLASLINEDNYYTQILNGLVIESCDKAAENSDS